MHGNQSYLRWQRRGRNIIILVVCEWVLRESKVHHVGDENIGGRSKGVMLKEIAFVLWFSLNILK